MYLMYVDESGDTGMNGSPTRFFALSGLVIHERDWRRYGEALIAFRKTMRDTYGLTLRTELHASVFVNKKVGDLKRNTRLSILRNFLDEVAKLDYISITSVVFDKEGKDEDVDIFDRCWKILFQRFENTLNYGNFPGGHSTDTGMAIVDNTNGGKLTKIVRKMAAFNPIPNRAAFAPGYRDIPILKVIEDPHLKDSTDSYFIQAADVCAYFLYQMYAPCSYVRRSGATNYYRRLAPVLNMRASNKHALGIVEL